MNYQKILGARVVGEVVESNLGEEIKTNINGFNCNMFIVQATVATIVN